MSADIQPTHPSQHDPKGSRSPLSQHLAPITAKAVLLGLFLVITLDFVAIQIRYVFHGSLMTYSHVPMALSLIHISEPTRH